MITQSITTVAGAAKITNTPTDGIELIHNPTSTKPTMHIRFTGDAGATSIMSVQASLDRTNWINVITNITSSSLQSIPTLAPYYRFVHNNSLGTGESRSTITIGN